MTTYNNHQLGRAGEDLGMSLWPGGNGGLLLLVGSSPLPNLIAILALRPPELALICSEDTADQTRILVEAARKATGGSYEPQVRSFGPTKCIKLTNPFSASAIRSDLRCFEKELSKYILFYTGGTKAMAVHSYQAWAGKQDKACYLSDRSASIIFDDGREISIRNAVNLDIDTLARLHGLEFYRNRIPEPILSERLDSPEYSDSFAKLKAALTTRISEPYDTASQAHDDDGESNLNPVTNGTWFECVVASFLVRAASEIGDRNSQTFRDLKGLLPQGNGKQLEFQLDAAQLAGTRLYAVSCTTSRKRSSTKLKIFEVVERSRQIGGDLARAAVVTLHDDEVECARLQAEAQRAWLGDQVVPRIFGEADVYAWHQGDLTSLIDWLKS